MGVCRSPGARGCVKKLTSQSNNAANQNTEKWKESVHSNATFAIALLQALLAVTASVMRC
jgi:hypothetical protein